MKELPTIPASCALDEAGVRAQADRYRAIGAGAELLEREPRRFVVRLRDGVETALVDEAVSVERQCCSFFDIAWEPESRRLRFSVSKAEDEPALDAIVHALGIGRRPPPVRPRRPEAAGGRPARGRAGGPGCG